MDPGFELAQNPNTVMGLDGYGPDPTGAVRKGRNSYRHPDFDGAIGRLFVTVSAPDRIPILRQIVSHMTGNAPVMGIFYGADPFLIGKQLHCLSASSVKTLFFVCDKQGPPGLRGLHAAHPGADLSYGR